jgi:hypothetical protein
MKPFVGIGSQPYLDLAPLLDTRELDAIDDEIRLGLVDANVTYTGGSHKWMGIVPPSLRAEPYVDYGEVIESFSREEFCRFIALADDPDDFDVDRQRDYKIGEEQEHGLSRRQMLYLKYRHGVYFPWKVFCELLPGGYWDDKSKAAGKEFTDEALALFPRTIAYVKRLPFTEIGRVNLLGLEANDHGTVHRDGDPSEKRHVDHFLTICPRADKRLFLWDEERREKTYVRGKVYWFNDSDYHGVEADPYFRYSIRVDGVFTPEFLARIEREVIAPRARDASARAWH